jgi:hypothetical protein
MFSRKKEFIRREGEAVNGGSSSGCLRRMERVLYIISLDKEVGNGRARDSKVDKVTGTGGRYDWDKLSRDNKKNQPEDWDFQDSMKEVKGLH